MPTNYKYEFISLGRMKVLTAAESEANTLLRESAGSRAIPAEVVYRLRVIRALVSRAANVPLGHDEIELLERRFGKDMQQEGIKMKAALEAMKSAVRLGLPIKVVPRKKKVHKQSTWPPIIPGGAVETNRRNF